MPKNDPLMASILQLAIFQLRRKLHIRVAGRGVRSASEFVSIDEADTAGDESTSIPCSSGEIIIAYERRRPEADAPLRPVGVGVVGDAARVLRPEIEVADDIGVKSDTGGVVGGVVDGDNATEDASDSEGL